MGVAKVLVQKARELNNHQFRGFVTEALEQKKFSADPEQRNGARFHILECAKEALGDAWAIRLQQFSARRGWVEEAATGATDTSAFKDVIGAMSLASMQDGYEHATSKIMSLFGTLETPNQPEGEHQIFDRYSATGKVLPVAPGTEYPRAGQATFKVAAPEPVKKGQIAVLTLETVKSNNTRQFLKDNLDVGRNVGIDQAETGIRVVVGLTNNYKRNDTTYNTYQLASDNGSWVNALDDFNALNGPPEFDRARLLLQNMRHPVTGKSINIGAKTCLAVGSSYYQALSVINATEQRFDNASSAGVTVGTNPYYKDFDVVEDPNVARIYLDESGLTATQVNSTMVYGDLKEAFKYREVEPFQTFETADQTDIAFFQDIVYAVKGRWWGSFFVNSPLHAVRLRKMS